MFSKQTDDASFHSGADQKGDFPLSSCRNRSGKHRDVELFEWSVCFETRHRRPLQLQCRYRAKNHSLPTSGLGLAGVVMRHSTKEPEGAYVCVCVFGAVDTGNFGLFQKRPRLRPDCCWVREAPNRKGVMQVRPRTDSRREGCPDVGPIHPDYTLNQHIQPGPCRALLVQRQTAQPLPIMPYPRPWHARRGNTDEHTF